MIFLCQIKYIVYKYFQDISADIIKNAYMLFMGSIKKVFLGFKKSGFL